MLAEYYFKIQHTKGTENARVDTLSRKVELQNNKKLLGAVLCKDKNRSIRYNYPKITVTREESQTYKILKSMQIQKI